MFAAVILIAAGNYLTACSDSKRTAAVEQGQIEAHAPVNSTSDLGQLCQLTLDQEPLQQYFHVDSLPDRKPLRVLGNNLVNESLSLVKFGVPVVILSPDQTIPEGTPYFEFKAVVVEGERARVSFEYPVEGIVGSARFSKSGKLWRVESFDLAER